MLRRAGERWGVRRVQATNGAILYGSSASTLVRATRGAESSRSRGPERHPGVGRTPAPRVRAAGPRARWSRPTSPIAQRASRLARRRRPLSTVGSLARDARQIFSKIRVARSVHAPAAKNSRSAAGCCNVRGSATATLICSAVDRRARARTTRLHVQAPTLHLPSSPYGRPRRGCPRPASHLRRWRGAGSVPT